jgi:hypothetical protein
MQNSCLGQLSQRHAVTISEGRLLLRNPNCGCSRPTSSIIWSTQAIVHPLEFFRHGSIHKSGFCLLFPFLHSKSITESTRKLGPGVKRSRKRMGVYSTKDLETPPAGPEQDCVGQCQVYCPNVIGDGVLWHGGASGGALKTGCMRSRLVKVAKRPSNGNFSGKAQNEGQLCAYLEAFVGIENVIGVDGQLRWRNSLRCLTACRLVPCVGCCPAQVSYDMIKEVCRLLMQLVVPNKTVCYA